MDRMTLTSIKPNDIGAKRNVRSSLLVGNLITTLKDNSIWSNLNCA
jgi:hypothetical protein